MMKMHSRKGFTLIELILAVALTAVIIVAACSVLFVGGSFFKSGTANAANQQKATLVESYLQRYASTASKASSTNDGKSAGIIFALKDGTLKISSQTVAGSTATVAPVASIDGIGQIGLNLDHNNSLNYTIVSVDNSYTLRGGIVMNNFGSGEVKNLPDTNGTVLFLFS